VRRKDLQWSSQPKRRVLRKGIGSKKSCLQKGAEAWAAGKKGEGGNGGGKTAAELITLHLTTIYD